MRDRVHTVISGSLLAVLFVLQMSGCREGSAVQIEFVESIPSETILDNADIPNTLDIWLDMVKKAEKDIVLSHFYVSPDAGDDSLDTFLRALRAAGERGVSIRLLVDGGMYRSYPETVDEMESWQNVLVHRYDMKAQGGGVLHTKYMIVDGTEIFIGSQNMDWRALQHIHELGIRVRQRELADFYMRHFELDWALSEESADPDSVLGTFYLLAEGRFSVGVEDANYGSLKLTPGVSHRGILLQAGNADEALILESIAQAEERIQIQLLSFSSGGGRYTVLRDALAAAGERGVKVEIILADWAKRAGRLDEAKALNALPGVTVYLSSIPEYSGGYIPFARVEHCKFMVIDSERFWLGTSNWSEGYFHKGRNVSLTVENGPLTERLSEIFEKSRDSAYCEVLDNGRDYEEKFYGEQD